MCSNASYASRAHLAWWLPWTSLKGFPNQVWDDITMDFIEALPKSHDIDTILVVVDRLTKYARFILLAHPFTAPIVVGHFVPEVVRLHGFPSFIVSDRDKSFLESFLERIVTSPRRHSAYHLQSDSQTEIVYKWVETYLRCFVNGNPCCWVNWLSWAEFSYNTSPHNSTHMTPFKALCGWDPPILIKLGRRQTPIGSLEEQLQERDTMIDELCFNLLRAK